MQLSNDDREHLANFELKLQLIRDRVAGVALGYATGFHLYGDGGCSKSFTVLRKLERLGTDFMLINSRLTGQGLFDQLAEFPDAVHVLEDIEQLTHDKGARCVLLSALWSQSKSERLITWGTHQAKLHCWFSGGIILIGNSPLEDNPELKALKTRIASLHLQPTTFELAALMRSVALQGFQQGNQELSAEDCLEVCEFAIARCLRASRSLDMRLLINSFKDRLQWQHGHSETHWQDLLESRLKGRVSASGSNISRAQTIGRHQEIALELSKMAISKAERERLWKERTGRSARAYYRRVAEVNREDCFIDVTV